MNDIVNKLSENVPDVTVKDFRLEAEAGGKTVKVAVSPTDAAQDTEFSDDPNGN